MMTLALRCERTPEWRKFVELAFMEKSSVAAERAHRGVIGGRRRLPGVNRLDVGRRPSAGRCAAIPTHRSSKSCRARPPSRSASRPAVDENRGRCPRRRPAGTNSAASRQIYSTARTRKRPKPPSIRSAARGPANAATSITRDGSRQKRRAAIGR